jgi:hypothetical protein
MAGPYSEGSYYFVAEQFGGSYGTSGNTVSRHFNVFPGMVVIHCGLTRVAAAEAIVGIIDYDKVGGRRTISFGTPENWAPYLYDQVAGFTLGLYVARGVAKGWFYVQAWS